MPALITLDQAKAHLRVTYTDEDPLITEYLEQASQLVLDFIKATYVTNEDGTWTETRPPDWTLATVPRPIQAAVLMVTAHLWRFRGDEAAGTATDGPLQDRVRQMLSMYRDPACA
jgi:hypothetical protein